jgi:glycosyltransferase involved in cell wall biosynthesis
MTHEIVVNGRFLSRRITGVERYGREILSLFGSNCRVEKTRMNGVAGHAWEQFILPTRLKAESILWSPANTGPLVVKNQALTIHDLTPLEHPEWFRKSFALWYRLFLPMLAKQVRMIFVPSEYVRQKVIKRLGAMKVIVTPNGVDTSRFHPHARQNTYEFPEKFILFVGSLQPGKNLDMLLRVWYELKDENPDIWLVVVGGAGSVFGKVKFLADERVRFLGYVSDDDLPGLYASALAFVLPSHDEGFGLPALEAMACGTPVVVSDGGALPEVVGAAGLIFKRSDIDSFSTMLRQCLNDEALHAGLIEKGFERVQNFSWQISAKLIWNTLNEL